MKFGLFHFLIICICDRAFYSVCSNIPKKSVLFILRSSPKGTQLFGSFQSDTKYCVL